MFPPGCSILSLERAVLDESAGKTETSLTVARNAICRRTVHDGRDSLRYDAPVVLTELLRGNFPQSLNLRFCHLGVNAVCAEF